MSELLSDLGFFVEEANAGFVPWNSSNESNFSNFSGDLSANSSKNRPFYCLKSLNGLPSYTEDFGFQWTQLYDDYRKDRYKHLDQFMRLGINPEDLHEKNVLDVGCGLGRLSEICLGRANYVFGLDLSAAVLEAARLIRSEKFVPIQASADNMPLKNNSFDFVYCWGVLHHTQNPSKTLAELWRVLKPGGTLAIWVYSRNAWYLRRSLLAKYYSNFDENEMLKFSHSLTTLSHTCQLTNKPFMKMLLSDLCYSIKNTKEYTRHVLYDGLGPSFHYLLDDHWFLEQSRKLEGLAAIEPLVKPFTGALLKKIN